MNDQKAEFMKSYFKNDNYVYKVYKLYDYKKSTEGFPTVYVVSKVTMSCVRFKCKAS